MGPRNSSPETKDCARVIMEALLRGNKPDLECFNGGCRGAAYKALRNKGFITNTFTWSLTKIGREVAFNFDVNKYIK